MLLGRRSVEGEFCTGVWDAEPPLLEAVAREWPVKRQQAGKKLSGFCGDL
jgi:hypothetical protein